MFQKVLVKSKKAKISSQVENSEPKLFFTTRIKVKHGLIVIKDESGPEGLKVLPFINPFNVCLRENFLCAFCILLLSQPFFGCNDHMRDNMYFVFYILWPSQPFFVGAMII